MGSQQMYSLSWGEFGTSLSSTVQILRGDNEMVDVTLAAGGRIFPAHKLVLSAASPLLMELLKSTQCPHPVVMLAGVTAPDLEALLQFVYQGEVSVDPSQLPSLLQAAYCLDIQALAPQPAASSEKTMVHVSVPVVTDNEFRDIDSLPPMNDQVYTTLSPLQPVSETNDQVQPTNDQVQPTNDQVQPTTRKRKRKRADRAKWPVTEGIVTNEQVSFISATQPAIDPGTDQAIAAELNDPALKTESMEEQHCNVESMSTKKLVSDLPVECTICGVTIRQSRNLRRHMELIHLKLPNAKRRNLGKEDLKQDEENVQHNVSVQTIQVVGEREGIVDEGVVEILAGPSRLTSPPAPHMLTAPPLYHPTDTLVYSQSQAVQFSGNENLFRQQQTELLRGAGLYADAREHCTAE